MELLLLWLYVYLYSRADQLRCRLGFTLYRLLRLYVGAKDSIQIFGKAKP